MLCFKNNESREWGILKQVQEGKEGKIGEMEEMGEMGMQAGHVPNVEYEIPPRWSE